MVGCSVAAPLFPAAPLQSRQARRGKTRPARGRSGPVLRGGVAYREGAAGLDRLDEESESEPRSRIGRRRRSGRGGALRSDGRGAARPSQPTPGGLYLVPGSAEHSAIHPCVHSSTYIHKLCT